LLATLIDKVIAPAEGKVKALQEQRRKIEAETDKVQIGCGVGDRAEDRRERFFIKCTYWQERRHRIASVGTANKRQRGDD
jgi:hypothetical protein